MLVTYRQVVGIYRATIIIQNNVNNVEERRLHSKPICKLAGKTRTRKNDIDACFKIPVKFQMKRFGGCLVDGDTHLFLPT